MQSLESNALEPTRAEMAHLSPAGRVIRWIPTYGLVLIMIALIILFSVTSDKFATLLNAKAMISGRAITAFLALAAMIPMVAGRIDLTIGFGVGLWHIVVIALVSEGLDWRVAAVLVLLGGALVGFLNGLLVEVAKIDSFIATLGTGTVLYALSQLVSGGRQVLADLPESFYALYTDTLFALPRVGFYILALATVMWLILEYTPIGRYLCAIGANPKAAELNGVPTRRYVIGAFMSSGMLVALAGVFLAAQFGVGQVNTGPDYLLPALVGAFLGSTTIKLGRVNVWGTMVGIVVLAIGISGIQQFGSVPWVESMFNGVTLLVAIGIAGYAQRRKGAAKK